MKLKILHIITGLGNGGAERTLVKVLDGLDKERFDCVVIALNNEDYYKEYLESQNIKVYYFGLKSPLLFYTKIFEMARIIKKESPDIIQTWLYHADLMGIFLRKYAKVKLLFWNVRSTKLSFSKAAVLTIFIRKICAYLSRYTTKIVNCSKYSIEEHKRIGYKEDKFVYIPNGYDNTIYYPDNDLSLRQQFGYTKDDFILGVVGRFDPQKDHENFLKALTLVKKKHPTIKAFLVGNMVIEANKVLTDLIQKYSLQSNVKLIGQRSDLINVYNTIDLLVLSSNTEAFPNVVAEAMLCGKSCVVTDVGDAKFIVGETGLSCPASDHNQLADAILKFMAIPETERIIMGDLAKQRIIDQFSISSMILKYQDLYLSHV